MLIGRTSENFIYLFLLAQNHKLLDNALTMRRHGQGVLAKLFSKQEHNSEVWYGNINFNIQVNAVYRPTENTATLPLSVVRPPFFDKSYPAYINTAKKVSDFCQIKKFGAGTK